jgi:hypothetical protein
LGRGDGVAGLQVLLLGARFDADVLLAEQATGQNLERAVLGKTVTVLKCQRHVGLKGLVVERDGIHTPNHHAGTLDRGLWLQTTNVVEARGDRVGLLEIQAQQVGRLQREEQQCRRADEHEQADPDVVVGTLHGLHSLERLERGSFRY